MRIMVVGPGGAVGRAALGGLGDRHEIVTAGRNSGDLRLDLADADSIRDALSRAGPLDAIACAAGNVSFGPLAEIGAADYAVGLADKLMGQVNLVLEGKERLADGGSFTLITGILAEAPIRMGSSASMVNGALNAFVMAAAVELPRGLRINAVSPGVLEESVPDYGPFFPGFEPVASSRVGLAYARSIEGPETGQVFRIV